MAVGPLQSPESPEHQDSPGADLSHGSRGLKRKRSVPLTPPISVDDPESTDILRRATHVVNTEATALSHLARHYETDPIARSGLLRAVDTILQANKQHGKLLICGVGKSGLVGRKTVATFKSLGVACSFLHGADAMHGDLGDIGPNDAVLFITYSGLTSELFTLLPHIEEHVPVTILTSHTEPATCPLIQLRPTSILLPAPIHEPERESFGVSAPTTSTTVAMAVGDMLALTASYKMHRKEVNSVFQRNHPGGAIGAKIEKNGSS